MLSWLVGEHEHNYPKTKLCPLNLITTLPLPLPVCIRREEFRE